MRALIVLVVAGGAACDVEDLFGLGGPVAFDAGLPNLAVDAGDADAGPSEPTCTQVLDGTWTEPGPPLSSARYRHTATLLKDGRVLLVGGQDDQFLPSTKAELYDPDDDTFAPTGDLAVGRYDAAAALLPDGRVAVFGGFEMGHLDSVEIWDPDDGAFTTGPYPMPQTRAGHTATAIADGRVVILGGGNTTELPTSVLVFDPDDATFSESADVSEGRTSHAAALLNDGRILMIGGFFTGPLNTVDVVDANLQGSDTAAPLPVARRSATATTLPDGRVLVTGGYGPSGVLDDAYLWSPTDDRWASTGAMSKPRFAHDAVLLDCAVLVCAGVDASGCEAWDLAAGTFVDVAGPAGSNFSFTSTRLTDGSVLFAGGIDASDAVLGTSARFTPSP